MRKYLIIPLLIAIFFIGCSQNKESSSTENSKTLTQKKIFTQFLDEKDLKSYILETSSEIIINMESDEEKDTSVSNGVFEIIKEPKISHSKWQDKNGDKKHESESYVIDNLSFYRENNGKWNKLSLKEEEKDRFVGKTVISSSTILKPLESYYELKETDDSYIARFKSDSNNIDEIKNILLNEEDDLSLFGELTSLEAEFFFKKDTYYPDSFIWEATFLNKDNNKVTRIKNTGKYEKVNELEHIELPEEIESLLN